MEGFELSIVINRPIEEVFTVLANLENDLKWRSEWVNAKNTSGGSLGVGATFRLSRELLGRQIPTVYEVIGYEPNQVAPWKTYPTRLSSHCRHLWLHIVCGKDRARTFAGDPF